MERLQKIIAMKGYCSRRKAEELIEKGKVRVNGEVVTTMGYKASVNDFIEVEGNPLDDIEEKDFSDTEKLKGVQEVYSDTEIVDVYCGGSGFGSATSYYGFYYSPDGLPKDSWCGSSFGRAEQLKPDGEGFSIKYSNDDNCYYTEKIRDNFYYYEAHF